MPVRAAALLRRVGTLLGVLSAWLPAGLVALGGKDGCIAAKPSATQPGGRRLGQLPGRGAAGRRRRRHRGAAGGRRGAAPGGARAHVADRHPRGARGRGGARARGPGARAVQRLQLLARAARRAPGPVPDASGCRGCLVALLRGWELCIGERLAAALYHAAAGGRRAGAASVPGWRPLHRPPPLQSRGMGSHAAAGMLVIRTDSRDGGASSAASGAAGRALPGLTAGSWRCRRAPLPSLADEPEPEDAGGHAAAAAADTPDAPPSEHRGAAAAAAAGSEPRR